MPKRDWPVAVLLMALVCATAPAGAQSTTQPDDQATMAEVQQTFRQIVMNMVAKGIDPRQFFQQMQDGADPADIAKQMVDQGLIDPQALARLQTNVQQMSTRRIRDRLDVTDGEWAVLEPMIRKVMTAQAVLDRARGMGGGGSGAGLMGGFMAVQTPTGTDLSNAVRTLRSALQSKNGSAEEIATALAMLRETRGRAAAELAAAQRELTSAVTLRQEAALVRIGILE